jgi:hypothetical protein
MDNSILLNEINENLKCIRAVGESLLARTIEQNVLLDQIAKQTAPKVINVEDNRITSIDPLVVASSASKVTAKATKTTTTKTVTKK